MMPNHYDREQFAQTHRQDLLREAEHERHLEARKGRCRCATPPQGELRWAAQLWGAADALGTPLPPVDRAAYERSVAATRAQLGGQAFAAAWAEGRTMTPEQVLAAQCKNTYPKS